MPERIMYVQLKTGYNTDRGPAWIARVRFTRTWRTAHVHGRTLRRVTGTARANFDSNFYDVDSEEEFWVSGLKRDRTDGRYSSQQPLVDDDVRDAYTAFLAGARYQVERTAKTPGSAASHVVHADVRRRLPKWATPPDDCSGSGRRVAGRRAVGRAATSGSLWGLAHSVVVQSWRDNVPNRVQEVFDGLYSVSLEAAENLLIKNREFLPFGLRADGDEAVLVAADPGLGEQPPSQQVLAMLYEGFRDERDTFGACAFVADVRLGDEGDAVRVDLEHRDGFALHILVPYRIQRFRRGVARGPMSVAEGEQPIWT